MSREDQELNLQIDALKKAGCLKQDIYIDKVSGTREKRPGLDECLSALQPGDTLLVWRLDRLGGEARKEQLGPEGYAEMGRKGGHSYKKQSNKNQDDNNDKR